MDVEKLEAAFACADRSHRAVSDREDDSGWSYQIAHLAYLHILAAVALETARERQALNDPHNHLTDVEHPTGPPAGMTLTQLGSSVHLEINDYRRALAEQMRRELNQRGVSLRLMREWIDGIDPGEAT